MREISARLFLIRAVSVLLMCLWTCTTVASATPIIAAYQKIYHMNFEVLSHAGLPAGWFVTSDGYVVAQIRPNHWVYGRSTHPGVFIPTEVAVGSVVPMDVPHLARVALPSWRSGAYNTRRFRSITARSWFDNMGVLDDPFAYTPVAWRSGEPELRIWLGDRWHSIVPSAGQSTTQALIRQHPFIIRTLERRNASWTVCDTVELADLAREWGFLWHGHIPFASLRGHRGGGARNVIIGRDRGMDAGGGDGWGVEGGGGWGAGDDFGGGWESGGGGGNIGGGIGGDGGWDSGGGSAGGDMGGGNAGGWD